MVPLRSLGFKAGFLLGGPPPKKPKAAAKPVPAGKEPGVEDITHLKAKKQEEAKKEGLKIDEVQNAMNASATILDKKEEWLSPDLL